MDVWEQNLADVIDDYLKNYKGMTGSGSPLATGLKPSAGPYMIAQAQTTGVDPSIILGICRSESSTATNPNLNGGQFNIYGNSAHFSVVAGSKPPKKTGNTLYTNYEDPTADTFALLQTYILSGLTSTDAIYKKYEGEASWAQNVPMIKEVQRKLAGDPDNERYSFDQKRKDALATLAAAIKK
jgi:hypothetical protein